MHFAFTTVTNNHMHLNNINVNINGIDHDHDHHTNTNVSNSRTEFKIDSQITSIQRLEINGDSNNGNGTDHNTEELN